MNTVVEPPALAGSARRSEGLRQWVHLGVGLFSLALRFLLEWQAITVAAAAIVFNLFVLPRLEVGKRIFRDREAILSGVRIYPIAVLFLVIFFDMPVAAGAWAVLAVGDSFSNFVGRAIGRAKLPWNAKKSWAGTIAFAVTAIPAAAFLLSWTAGPPISHASVGGAGAVWTCAIVGGLVGAFVESLDLPIDDNLTVSLTSGVAMMLVSRVVS